MDEYKLLASKHKQTSKQMILQCKSWMWCGIDFVWAKFHLLFSCVLTIYLSLSSQK